MSCYYCKRNTCRCTDDDIVFLKTCDNCIHQENKYGVKTCGIELYSKCKPGLIPEPKFWQARESTKVDDGESVEAE